MLFFSAFSTVTTRFLRSPLFSVGLLALCLGVTGNLSAQAPSGEQKIRVNMKNAELRSIIQWAAEKTKKQIIIDPRVKGRITVLAEDTMTIDQAYELIIAALDVYGYAAVENKGIVRIIPASQARVAPKELVQSFNRLSGAQPVVHVYTPENARAEDLATLLRPLVPQAGLLRAFKDNNSLIIADEAENISRLVELARMLDANSDMDISIVSLKFAQARDVAGLLSSLFRTEGSENAISISYDARANAILFAGDAKLKRDAEEIIAKLDREFTPFGQTKVIYLEYASAEDILPSLQSLATGYKSDDKNLALSGTSVSVEALASANAIILSATSDILAKLEAVIDELDVRRRQVIVDAVIMDVTDRHLQELGVEWNTKFNGEGVEAATGFGNRSGTETTIADVIAQGLSLGYFRNGSLRGLISAAQSDTDINLLSTPSITTLENEEAEILVGSNVPFITGQRTGTDSDTDNPFTTIQREDIGISLIVTPIINGKDTITLDVNQEVETISASNEASDLITDKRSIKTRVMVPDGGILVFGGLSTEEKQYSVSKVPVLGDIPLVGRLFKNTTTQSVRRNLMVFIKPRILDENHNSTDEYEKLRAQLQKK